MLSFQKFRRAFVLSTYYQRAHRVKVNNQEICCKKTEKTELSYNNNN